MARQSERLVSTARPRATTLLVMQTRAVLAMTSLGWLLAVGCGGSSHSSSSLASGGTVATGGAGTGGAASGGIGGAASGGIGGGIGGATGGSPMDAGNPDVAGRDVEASDVVDAVLRADSVAMLDLAIDRAGDGGQVCTGGTGGNVPPPSGACRAASDCTNMPGARCCTSSPCWPASACPIPPTMCGTLGSGRTWECNVDTDCKTSGKCVKSVEGCPQCEYRGCQYPPPPCTQSPDSCLPTGVCQSTGSCTPRLCTDGYVCPSGTRCLVGGPAANANGCQPIPCDQSWTCAENTRCTAPANPVDHGCTALTCKNDCDCDSGACVEGLCRQAFGSCSAPPA